MRSYRPIDLLEGLETFGTFITGFSIVDHNNRRLTISIIVAVDDEGRTLGRGSSQITEHFTCWGVTSSIDHNIIATNIIFIHF